MSETKRTLGIALAATLLVVAFSATPAAADHPNESIQTVDGVCETAADAADDNLPLYLGDDVCPLDEFGLNCQSHTCLPIVVDP